MSSFEYVMVIVSIIVGLGITTLLKGAVNAIRTDTELAPGLLHGLWVVLVLLQHVALWSLRWSGQRREDWPAEVLLVYLLIPIFFYAQAELLFPPAGRKVNLTKYFLSNRRPFFSLAILSYVAAAIGPFVFYDGVDPVSGGAVTVIPYAIASAVSLILVFSGNERLHLACAATFLVLMATNFLPSLTVG